MKILPPQTRKPRTEPVKYGSGSHGRRALVKAVMEAGFPKSVAEKAVNAVIESWVNAVKKRDHNIEMPIGTLRVQPTPKFCKNRIARRNLFGKPGRLKTWIKFKDPYRVIWRMPPDEWKQLLEELNPENHP